MNESLDVRRTLGALRRRRQWIVACSMAGALLGLGIALVQKPVYVAASSVLLPPSPVDNEGQALRSIETEARIAASAEIFVPVSKEATPWITVAELRDRVRVRAVSNDILEMRVEDSSPWSAVQVADAVAKQFVAYANGTAAGQADTTISVLQREADELRKRILQLEADAAAGTGRLAGLDQRSPEGARQAALVDSLRNASVEAARQLALVNTKISEARLDAELSSRGTRILQPAITPSAPASPRRALNIAGGAGLGLLLGAVTVLFLYSRDRRLRSRDAIAEAVGAPVVASLKVSSRGGVRACRSLAEGWEPSTAESFILRRAFSVMGLATARPPMNLVVQSLPGDSAGPRLALQSAICSAAAGVPTAFAIASQHSTAADLRVVINSLPDAELRPHLMAYSLGGNEMPRVADAGLTVTAVVADGESFTVPTWGVRTVTVLAVSAGFATSETLARVAIASLDAGHPVTGVFVANPDPTDRTTGRAGFPTAVLPPVAYLALGEGSDEVTAGVVPESPNGHQNVESPAEPEESEEAPPAERHPPGSLAEPARLDAPGTDSSARSATQMWLRRQRQTEGHATRDPNLVTPHPGRFRVPAPPEADGDDGLPPESQQPTGENARPASVDE